MKTSVNMIRNMGNFKVTQRTKDSMFNATELLKQWNTSKGMKKEVKDFFVLKSTKEFIKTIENDNMGDSPYLKTRGKNGGTWMHPYLFLDFAMWLNPKFKLSVIKFVYDQLIEFRHSAGDMYKGLTNAINSFDNVNYIKVAKALNWIVFDKHEKDIRNTANKDQLTELTDIQKKLAFAIDMGYISNYNELLDEMRKMWYLKYNAIKF